MANQSRQQVQIKAAVDTLVAMFDTMERSTIQMVLVEGCGGNMEQAVEALLLMTGGISQKSREMEIKQRREEQREIDAKKNIKKRNIDNNNNNNKNINNNKKLARVAAIPSSSVNLADDFLRPPSYYIRKYPSKDMKINIKKKEQQQISENEIFNKQLFEDSLFVNDLQQNPEWVLEEMNSKENRNRSSSFNKNEFINNNNNKQSSSSSSYKSPFQEALARKKRSQSMFNSNFDNNFNQYNNNNIDNNNNINNNNNKNKNNFVDPTNKNSRQQSFKEKFNNLGIVAKKRIEKLAHKLAIHKQNSKKKSSNNYSGVLTSLDDEPLIEDESLIIDEAKPENRNTYQPVNLFANKKPKKPSQNL